MENGEIWAEKARNLSKIKSRLQAEWVALSKELCISAVFVLSRNLVVEELRVKSHRRRTIVECIAGELKTNLSG